LVGHAAGGDHLHAFVNLSHSRFVAHEGIEVVAIQTIFFHPPFDLGGAVQTALSLECHLSFSAGFVCNVQPEPVSLANREKSFQGQQ